MINTGIHTHFSFYKKLLKNSFSKFFKEDIFTQSAALAYYMIFALPPMLIIILWLVGLWYEEELVRGAVFDEFGVLMGADGASQIMNTLEKISSRKPTLLATIIGVVSLLFMVSTVFVTIKQELNRIFEVNVKKTIGKAIWMTILNRFLSIAMLSIIALILTISMVINALITTFSENMEKWIGEYTNWLSIIGFVLLNLLILTLLFAITFRYVPENKLKWGDTWFGAFFTAVLFVAGKSFIGFFIGKSQVSSFYDAAGSFLVLMLWVYYTSMIFYFGAIMTYCRAKLLLQSKE